MKATLNNVLSMIFPAVSRFKRARCSIYRSWRYCFDPTHTESPDFVHFLEVGDIVACDNITWLYSCLSPSILDRALTSLGIKSWSAASAQLSTNAHWLQTHNHLRMVILMLVVALCCTDGQTAGRYQAHSLPASLKDASIIIWYQNKVNCNALKNAICL